MADNEKTYLLKVELDASALEKGAKESEKAIKEISDKMKALREEGKQNTLEYAKLRTELQKNNKNLNDSAKALNALDAQQKSNTNTLEELRQRLAAAAIGFAKMDQATNPEAYEEARKNLSDLREEVNNIQKSYGNAVLDVGKYEKGTAMLGATLDEIRQKMDALSAEGLQNSQEFKTLAAAYEDVKEETKKLAGDMEHLGKDIIVEVTGSISKMEDRLYEMALAGDTTSKEFIELQKQTASYKKIILEVDASIDALAESGGALGSALQLGEGLVSGYQALTGATALLGGENEALLETLTKLEAAQAVLSSLESAQLAIRRNAVKFTQLQAGAQNLLNKAIGDGSKASKIFRGALLATGVGALIVGIGLLIENFDKIKQSIFGATIAQDALNETVDKYKEGAKEAIIQTSKVEAAFKLAKNGVISKEEALQTYNDTLGDAFGKMDNLNDAEAVFAAKTKAFVEAAGLRAQSTALFEKAAEEQANALAATLENQVGFWDQFTSSFGQGWNIATGNTEDFWKTQNKLQEDAVAELKKTSNERSKIFTEEAQRLLMEAETIENANDISNDSEKELAEDRKKRSEEWKKRQDEYLKGAEELALTLRDSLLGETELTLSNQRKAVEAHYAFLEKAARNNTDALIQISEAKNADLARIESEEKAAARKQIEVSYADEIKAAEKKYNDLANLAKKNGNDITQIKADETALITSLTEQMNSELESVELDFNNRRVQREYDFIAEVEDLNKSREESTKAALNEIEIAEKELALELSKGTKQEESRWQDLQRVKIQQLQKANAEVINNEQLTAAERLAIVAENELAIQRLRNETFEHNKQLSEQSNASQLSLATSFVSSAQSLSDGYFQLQQNQLQQQLNDITEQYDYEAKLLQDKLDAGLISQAEFNAKKSALDAEQAAKESKLKREQWKKERQQKYISAILNTALGVTSALTTQPFMPLGIIAAATAAALGGFQVAAIASEPEPKFAKGTAIQSGIFGGKSHAQGGVKLSADGVPFGEAEKDEIFVILNKNAKNHLNTLSNLNESTGGVSFTGGKKMARGGLMKFQSGVALSATAPALSQSSENKFQQENAVIQAVANMPNPIVFVEDMTAKQSNQVEIRSRADV